MMAEIVRSDSLVLELRATCRAMWGGLQFKSRLIAGINSHICWRISLSVGASVCSNLEGSATNFISVTLPKAVWWKIDGELLFGSPSGFEPRSSDSSSSSSSSSLFPWCGMLEKVAPVLIFKFCSDFYSWMLVKFERIGWGTEITEFPIY